ncbi:HET-domain-containing protein [Xylariaceae sp. FL1651]|nr:HET-domain-containing protein [Xylariaceae sp. FL1651]
MLPLSLMSMKSELRSSRWTEVDHPSHQFRLLDNYPEAASDEIECKLYTCDLNEPNLKYNALSYVWGTSQSNSTIQVNGFDEVIRHPQETVTMWIDSSHQVNLMSRIYKQCTKCIIWLGDFADCEPALSIADVQSSFDLIDYVCKAAENPEAILPTSLERIENRRAASRAIAVFLSLTWCSSIVLWGPLSISWELLEQASIVLVQGKHAGFHVKLSEFWHPNIFCMTISTIRILRQTKESTLDRLWRLRYRQATVPLDKIYGLLGLLDEGSLSRIGVSDYTLDPAGLYKRITLCLIELENGLKPFVGFRGESKRTPGLSTWVIDWVPEQDKLMAHSRSADDGIRIDLSRMNCSADGALSLSGVHVDKVERVSIASHDMHPLECDDAKNAVLGQIAIWTEFVKIAALEGRGARYSLEDSFEKLICGEFPEIDVSQNLLITETGYIGLGPRTLKAGDEIWVLFGGKVPFALRRKEVNGASRGLTACEDDFELVGDAFVYGIMSGEAVRGDEALKRMIRLH